MMTGYFQKTIKALVLFFFIGFHVCEAKEVGDVVYYPLNQQWGADADQYTFSSRSGTPGYIGHAMIYIGTDENGKDYIIHAPGGGDVSKREQKDLSHYVRNLNVGSSIPTKEQRRKIISFANSKLGKPYPSPYLSLLGLMKPSIEEQKGYDTFNGEESYSCVGLVERSYEAAQVGGVDGPTPNGYGRDLVNNNEDLFNNWNAKEGSYVKLLTDYSWPYNEIDGWVFFP